jgi:hypothetical protein
MRAQGGKMYFARVQMAHIFEAMGDIEDITKSCELQETVDRCDSMTRRSFEKLVKFLNSKDYDILLRIRNNLLSITTAN